MALVPVPESRLGRLAAFAAAAQGIGWAAQQWNQGVQLRDQVVQIARPIVDAYRNYRANHPHSQGVRRERLEAEGERHVRQRVDRYSSGVRSVPSATLRSQMPRFRPYAVRRAARGMRAYKRRRYVRAARLGRNLRGLYQRAGRWACVDAQGPEKKFKIDETTLTNGGAGVQLDTTPEIIDNELLTITQGDGANQRDGRQICVTRIAIKGEVGILTRTQSSSGGLFAGANAFFWLVQDTQCNGAAATVSSATVGVFTGTNSATLFRTPYTYNRFKILKFKKVWCRQVPYHDQNAVTDTIQPSMRPFSMIWHAVGRTGIPVDYTSTTGAITERISNNVFLIGSSDTVDDILRLKAHTFVNWYDM